MNTIQLTLLVTVFLYFFSGAAAIYSDIEAKVAEKLLLNYSTTGRPTESSTEPVTVSFDMKLHKIEKLITKEQHLIIHTFVTMRWKEPRFIWDPAEFNGTKLINIDRASIWKPDIILYNSADVGNNGPADFYKAPAHVYYNGTIVWFSTVAWQSSCAVDVTWFPVDEQTCDLVFGSLSYSKSRLKLTFHKMPTKYSDFTSNHHVTNGEWTVTKLAAKTNEHHYDCCHEAVSQVVYSLTLKRRPLYFFLYLIFPVIAIVLLSLLVFKIPAQCGERIGFSVTVLLTMGVYLVVISQDLPRTADNAPLVGVLYVTLFYVMVLGVLTGTLNARLAFKTTPPPDKLYKFVLRMKAKKFKKVRAKIESFRNSHRKNGLKPVTEMQEVSEDSNKELDNEQQGDASTVFENVTTPRRAFLRQKSSLIGRPDTYVQELTEQDIDNQLKWQEIADFSDHVFFWLYLALIIISSSSVLLGLQIKKGSA